MPRPIHKRKSVFVSCFAWKIDLENCALCCQVPHTASSPPCRPTLRAAAPSAALVCSCPQTFVQSYGYILRTLSFWYWGEHVIKTHGDCFEFSKKKSVMSHLRHNLIPSLSFSISWNFSEMSTEHFMGCSKKCTLGFKKIDLFCLKLWKSLAMFSPFIKWWLPRLFLPLLTKVQMTQLCYINLQKGQNVESKMNIILKFPAPSLCAMDALLCIAVTA